MDEGIGGVMGPELVEVIFRRIMYYGHMAACAFATAGVVKFACRCELGWMVYFTLLAAFVAFQMRRYREPGS